MTDAPGTDTKNTAGPDNSGQKAPEQPPRAAAQQAGSGTVFQQPQPSGDTQQPYVHPTQAADTQQPAEPITQQHARPVTQGPSAAAPGQPPPPAGGGDEPLDNPFAPPQQPDQPPRGVAIKKILAAVVLIAVAVGVLFFVFTIGRRVLQRNQAVTLTYWGLWEDAVIMEPLIDEYERQHPNVTINYVKESPRQYRERLQTQVQKGSGPDIFRFHNTWVPMLIEDLATVPQSVMGVDEFRETFYPVAAEDLIVDGNIVALPLEIDGLALYYNEDLFRAAGVLPPKSWEDLQDAANAIVVRGEGGTIITGGIALGTANNVEHFSDIIALMMLQNGADLKNPTSTEAEGALAFYRLFAQEPNQVWSAAMDNSIFAFANEQVGMILAPSWQAHIIADINPELSFKTVPVPQLPGANIAWASYWVEGVSARSDNQETAWDFLAFLASRETSVQFFSNASNQRGFGEPYARVDLASELSEHPVLGAYIQQAPISKSFFLASRTFDNGLNDRLIQYTRDGVNSLRAGVAPQEATAVMRNGFAQVLSDFGLVAPAQQVETP